ncbi:MAG: peptidylprolyl isomerase [Betaproteobacteria bacterium]|nr:peptidylprolyl isomerase [Betaproteobacteria bacterium]
MKTMTLSTAIALAFALSFAGTTTCAQSAAAVAKVNGKEIPQSRADFVIKANGGQGQPDSPELRTRVREVLIRNELLAQEAAKKGLDKTPDFLTQIELNRQEALVNAFIQDYVKNNPVTDEAVKAEYDRAKSQAGDMEYKARHILVKDEAEAKQIIAQIKKGGSFDKIAAQKSQDPGSKDKGGDLDWAPGGRYVPPFAEALKKLKKGQMTDTPVQTQFGWHVIKVDDERAMKIPPLEEVRPQITQGLQRQALEKYIAELRTKAKIE